MLHYEAYIFDLDGTIYLGNNVIEGAARVVDELQRQNKKLLFLTNKTIDSRLNYVTKLNRMGIPARVEQILSPTQVLIHYLKQQGCERASLYVIGEDLLKEELKAAGFVFAKSPSETKIVILSWERDFHYQHILFAYKAIKNGAMVIATNPDRTCPMPDGEVPDCGSIIGAIEGATGKAVDMIIGKPSPITLKIAKQTLNVGNGACLVVGDRLETDIKMGSDAGMDTALVLTGITKLEDLRSSKVKPTYVLQSVKDILPDYFC